MTAIPSALLGSLAGIPLAQSKGADADKAVRETVDRLREISADERAADAEGIGETEQESAAGEKDADGRQVLVRSERQSRKEGEESAPPKASKDPTGHRGTQLDLEG